MIVRFTKTAALVWAKIVYRHAIIILIVAVIVTGFALSRAASIQLSTDIDALMPESAKTVQTLNTARKKTGSTASIQIVVQSNDAKTSLDFIADVKTKINEYEWVESSQYFEDIEVLSKHKLLRLNVDELLQLERDVNQAYPVLLAKEISSAMGVDATITLRGENISGDSKTKLDRTRLDDLLAEATAPQHNRQYFVSEDELTAVLIVWPKAEYGSLVESKMMVSDAHAVIERLTAVVNRPDIQAGVAGRIASQVIQFETILGDLKLGLLSAITLIAALLTWSYRRFAVAPAIFIPLIMGIIWTVGLTAITIGGLNLITAFLILILFGLGIDFGIHNTSRYLEERGKGETIERSISVIISETGSASLIAALTTAASFYALMLTEFRAFTEFGFIAGSGILLTFIAMYCVLPAIFVVLERFGWRSDKQRPPRRPLFRGVKLPNVIEHRGPILMATICLFIFAAVFAPQMRFESNMKNLEARMPGAHSRSRTAVKQVIKTSNSRAIIVAETHAELVAIDNYFKHKIKTDTLSPTINKVSSLLDFVPPQESQQKRLDVIRRLKTRADYLQNLDPETYRAGKSYLSIDALNVADLPPTLRRSFLGSEAEPGYLIYVDNAVNMDDARLAKQFYDDVAKFSIDGQDYYSASESFILVEMLALMKADAIKAIALVILTTTLMIFLFIRRLKGTLVVLIPPLIGIFVTLGIMGAFGPSLSIMNMVILPSLVGISVDNAIHIFHRFEREGARADITKIMQNTGRAAILTTLTTLIGFGGMITASMGGLRAMALLAIIGFLSCLLMTWVLLPVLLDIYRSRTVKRLSEGVLT